MAAFAIYCVIQSQDSLLRGVGGALMLVLVGLRLARDSR
jgi:hypothetical protein